MGNSPAKESGCCNYSETAFRACPCVSYKPQKKKKNDDSPALCAGCGHATAHDQLPERAIPVRSPEALVKELVADAKVSSAAAADSTFDIRRVLLTPRFDDSGEYSGDAQIGFVSGELSQELLSYLQAEKMFNLSAEEILDAENSGFTPCIDYPRLTADPTRHVYYEGYFHTLATNQPAVSINPRNGCLMQKPAGPIRLRAFGCLLRELNQDWLAALAEEVPTLKPLLPYVFADAAVQIHLGYQVDLQHVGYHTDNQNSGLHCALSIRGTRGVHLCRVRETASEVYDQVVQWQKPGRFYVSSPAAVQHGVQHIDNKTWEDRVIAVQFRFLYAHIDAETGQPSSELPQNQEYDFYEQIPGLREEAKGLFRRINKPEFNRFIDLLSEALTVNLVLPTLTQLQARVSDLELLEQGETPSQPKADSEAKTKEMPRVVLQDTWDEPEDEELVEYVTAQYPEQQRVVLAAEEIQDLTAASILAPFFDTSLVQSILARAGVAYDIPDCYPDSLCTLFRRNIQTMTAAACFGLAPESEQPILPFFVKPVGQAKTFGQRVETQEHVEELLAIIGDDVDQLVYKCALVTFECEFRLFIAEGKLVGCQDASRDLLGHDAKAQPEPAFLEEVLEANQEPFAVIDVGMQSDQVWCVVEQNPPFSLASYGLPIDQYVSFCQGAWQHIRDSSRTQ